MTVGQCIGYSSQWLAARASINPPRCRRENMIIIATRCPRHASVSHSRRRRRGFRRSLVERILRDAHYDVSTASGRRPLNVCRRSRRSMARAHVMMPEMTGGTARQLRCEPDIKVLQTHGHRSAVREKPVLVRAGVSRQARDGQASAKHLATHVRHRRSDRGRS
jgi:CheY-like chemotaxis protein